MASANERKRLDELETAPVGRLLLRYSVPAVCGTVVNAIYNIIDSMVIGHAIDDPSVVTGIAVTFPVMNIVVALGTLVGAGAAARVSILLGRRDMRTAEVVLGNCVQLTLIIGLTYALLFACFMDPLLRLFGASDNSLPYASEFMYWILPGLVLQNVTYSYNNVMRVSGYPGKAMYTNLIGAAINCVLAPLFLFGFGWGIRGAAIATDIAMTVTAVWVMGHFCRRSSTLHFTPGTYRFNWPVIGSVLYIGLAPFLLKFSGTVIIAIVNNTLLHYGGDNAVAAMVVFSRYITLFTFTIFGICQGMQPIVGYNYGAGRPDRILRAFWLTVCAASVVALAGSLLGFHNRETIASLFMQDPQQIACAANCVRITTVTFWIVGLQSVAAYFFQSLGMPGRSIAISLSRQLLFLVPLVLVFPKYFGLDGVWYAYPVSDFLSGILAAVLVSIELRRLWNVSQSRASGRFS